MRIKFMGAVRTVTGSMHLLQANGSRILLDCGLVQGRRQESFQRNRNLPFDPAQVDALILSHAHIDHSGSIPTLVREGFRGNIYATFATRDLCSAMLRDSAYIQESDAEYLNRKRKGSKLPLIQPIYTMADAMESLKYFVGMGYERWFAVAPGVKAIFYDAGHILGSAITILEVSEGSNTHRLVYTGDLGRRNLPILRDPHVVHNVDHLIIESTYGGRSHETPEEAENALREVVNQTHRRGGKVIIPAFAVGRTQELVYGLHRLHATDAIPNLRIFVDSPLAVNVTEIFRLHPECYDEEISEFMMRDDDHDPFGFGRLQYVRNVEQSKALNSLEESCIIISASGMCEAGRILHHLKNNISDPRNTILIVGFQAEHTLGRRIVERRKRVSILGGDYDLRARVRVINGYSAHADREELLEYVRRIRDFPRKVFVVHGNEAGSEELASGLRDMGLPDVLVPFPMQEMEVG